MKFRRLIFLKYESTCDLTDVPASKNGRPTFWLFPRRSTMSQSCEISSRTPKYINLAQAGTARLSSFSRNFIPLGGLDQKDHLLGWNYGRRVDSKLLFFRVIWVGFEKFHHWGSIINTFLSFHKYFHRYGLESRQIWGHYRPISLKWYNPCFCLTLQKYFPISQINPP